MHACTAVLFARTLKSSVLHSENTCINVFKPVQLLFRCTAKEWSYFTFAQQWPLAVCTEVTYVRGKKKDTFTL